MRPGGSESRIQKDIFRKKTDRLKSGQASENIYAIQPLDAAKGKEQRIYKVLASHDFRPEIRPWSMAYVSNCKRD